MTIPDSADDPGGDADLDLSAALHADPPPQWWWDAVLDRVVESSPGEVDPSLIPSEPTDGPGLDTGSPGDETDAAGADHWVGDLADDQHDTPGGAPGDHDQPEPLGPDDALGSSEPGHDATGGQHEAGETDHEWA